MNQTFRIALLTWLSLVLPLMTRTTSHAETLTIGSYNVRNFYDVFDDPYTEDEATPVKPRVEIKQVAAALRAMDADIVVLQEVENEPVLRAMLQEFWPDSGYRFIACGDTNSGRGMRQGVLSRYPIIEMRSTRFVPLTHPDAPGRSWRFARDLTRATIETDDGQTVEVFAVHLKSNRDGPDDPDSRLYRTAEAMAIKRMIRAELENDPELLAVVAGDFNSNYETRPEQPRPWPAMAHLLADDPVTRSALLVDLHRELSAADRVTIPPSEHFPAATFDYILATPAMAERCVPGSARVYPLPEPLSGSDHFPVSASFELSKQPDGR